MCNVRKKDTNSWQKCTIMLWFFILLFASSFNWIRYLFATYTFYHIFLSFVFALLFYFFVLAILILPFSLFSITSSFFLHVFCSSLCIYIRYNNLTTNWTYYKYNMLCRYCVASCTFVTLWKCAKVATTFVHVSLW